MNKQRRFFWQWLIMFALLNGRFLWPLDPDKAISQYVHMVWGPDQGLPQHSVMTVIQTRDGYIWLGTQEGLVRFDGVQFRVFDKNNTPGIPNNKIYFLHETVTGSLWIATGGGGVSFLRAGIFRTLDSRAGLASDVVWAIASDSDRHVWLGTENGLSEYSAGTIRTVGTATGFSRTNVRALCFDHQQRLWVGTTAGLYLKMEYALVPGCPELASESITALFEDGQGRLWVGTNSQGLYCLDGKRWSRIAEQDGLPAGAITSICQDWHDSLWIGFRRAGLVRLRKGKVEIFSERQGLSDNWIRALFCDHEGGLWVGTTAGGLNRLGDGKFLLYGVAEGLPADDIYPVLEDRQGNLWFGTGGGLGCLTKGHMQAYTAADGLISPVVFSLYEDADGALLIGTDKGMNRLWRGRIGSFLAKHTADQLINVIYRDRQGALWIGTLRGLLCIRGQSVTRYTAENGLTNDSVRILLEDRQGDLWIGTYGGGLNRYRAGRFSAMTSHQGLSNNVVISLHEDEEGKLWIGTNGGGLNRWDGKSLRHLGVKQGLFDDTIHTILDDGQGNFWFSCNRGIFRLAKEELRGFLNGRWQTVRSVAFNKADGMRDSECNGARQPAGWRTRDGRLCFASSDGVVVVDPLHIHYDNVPPAVIMEEIKVDDHAPDIRDPLIFPPGTRRFEFHYTAFSYSAPEKIHFKYMLAGFDSDWVDAGNRRTAFYTNIPPGKYSFRVIAGNYDNAWNKVGATLAFRLQPFFYQTSLFFVVACLLLLYFAFILYRLRIRQLRKREGELAELVEERTVELRDSNQQLEGANRHLEEDARQIMKINQTLELQTQKLAEANAMLERLSNLDGLTGIANRRYFEQFIDLEWRRSAREQKPLSLIMIDVDFFKKFNDCYGHLEGDDCLKKVANALCIINRAGDLVARYGGEEFVVVLANTDDLGALAVAERMWKKVSQLKIAHAESSLCPYLTISLGVATLIPKRPQHYAELILAADQALYQAKREGRNGIRRYDMTGDNHGE